ncbi:hypothetical protein SELMODRAFT_406209 [Selaginella moellendorffii]|uniref:Transmembrane protein n=1 Tax=Selaginella moellendorffii TaxID=88036 RepID=D8R1M1_SELML|nr:hypothetical protein SELMODRAFT_406209 [Selaginella moellendorffii]
MARRTTGATGAEVFCWALPLLMVVLPGIILSRNEKGSAQEDTRTRKYKKEARRSSRKNFSFRVFEEAAYLCVAERADEPRETHRLQASWDIPPIVTVKSNELDPYGLVRQEIKSFCLPYGVSGSRPTSGKTTPFHLSTDQVRRSAMQPISQGAATLLIGVLPAAGDDLDHADTGLFPEWARTEESGKCGSFGPDDPVRCDAVDCWILGSRQLRRLRRNFLLFPEDAAQTTLSSCKRPQTGKGHYMRDNASLHLVTRQYDSEAEKNGVNISAAMVAGGDEGHSRAVVEDAASRRQTNEPEIDWLRAVKPTATWKTKSPLETHIELAREMGCSSWRKHGVLAVAILGAATAMAAATFFLGRSLTDAAKSLSDSASSMKESLDSSAKSFKESFDSAVASFDRGVASLDRGIDTIGAFKVLKNGSATCKFKSGGNLLELSQQEEFHGQVACKIAEQRCHHEHQAALEEWRCYFGYDVKTAAVPNEMLLLLLASPQVANSLFSLDTSQAGAVIRTPEKGSKTTPIKSSITVDDFAERSSQIARNASDVPLEGAKSGELGTSTTTTYQQQQQREQRGRDVGFR